MPVEAPALGEPSPALARGAGAGASGAGDLDGDFVRLTPVESAIGWPAGEITPRRPAISHASPRLVLEELVLQSLRTGPTYVSFSGGRDSSAILAVATHVARREGLPDPVPMTVEYPGLSETDEAAWQEAVLEHLRIEDRVVIPVRGEQTLLGPRARSSLERRGALWPSALHTYDVFLERVSGAHLLTGEGGDEVVASGRITPLRLLLRDRVRANRALVRASGLALAPDPVRSAIVRRRASRELEFPWLRGEAIELLLAVETQLARSRLRWDRAVAGLLTRRAAEVFEVNYARLARDHAVAVRHPLRDHRFVLALAAAGSGWGFQGRTHLMRYLFSDLLPDAVLARTSKATFNSVRFGDDERDFARSWDGSGVSAELVDVERLRDHWLSPRPFGVTGTLLHQAWLASGRRIGAAT